MDDAILVVPQLPLTLVSAFPDHELIGLLRTVETRLATHPVFFEFVQTLLKDEIFRRQSGGAIELSSRSIPPWTNGQLGEALVSSYIFANWPLTEQMAKFADEIHRHVLSAAGATLECQGDRYE